MSTNSGAVQGCIRLEFSEGLEFSEVLAAAGDVDNPAQPEYNRHRRRVPPTTTSVVPPLGQRSNRRLGKR